jgi:hypothetical protein
MAFFQYPKSMGDMGIQNMGDITLLLAIDIFFENGVTTNQMDRLIIVQLRDISSFFREKK